MKVIFGGVRGTSSVARPNFMKYGGETTSVLIEGRSGERIVIDAGTGIARLAERIMHDGLRSKVLLLVTHFHLDHLVGLPSLPMIYHREASFEMASPRKSGRTLESVVSRMMAQPLWPVQMEDVHASIKFLDWKQPASTRPHRFGHLEVRWCPVRHPGGCTAYRIDEPATGASFVFATDIEWGLSSAAERHAFLALCSNPSPAKLLAMDGQFESEHYADFKGWGHSTWQDVLSIARTAGVRRVLVTHFAPQHDDRLLAREESKVRKAMRGAGLARVGMEVAL